MMDLLFYACRKEQQNEEEIKIMRKNDVQDTRKKTNGTAKNVSSEQWIAQRKNALNYSDKQRFTIMFGAVMPM